MKKTWEEITVWTRTIIVACGCLLTSCLSAAAFDDAEVVPTPAPYQQSMPSAMPCQTASDTPVSPPTHPWYYWWSSWYWFDRCNDRGQHHAYLPPLPGWYYFRPYSVAQLRAQQEAVMRWGGDPRNPYASGFLPAPPQRAQREAVARYSNSNENYVTAASYTAPASVIPWPKALQGPRFTTDRMRIEAPYHRNRSGEAPPTAADYQTMIDAVARMKVILWQMTTEVPPQESIIAEKFLDQLAAEARDELEVGMATVASGP